MKQHLQQKKKVKAARQRISGDKTFGNTVRAYRLGYREYDPAKCFMKISPIKAPDESGANGEFLISLCPFDEQIPIARGHSKDNTHVCWWDLKDVDFLKLVKAPTIKRVKRFINFVVNSNGEIIW